MGVPRSFSQYCSDLLCIIIVVPFFFSNLDAGIVVTNLRYHIMAFQDN